MKSPSKATVVSLSPVSKILSFVALVLALRMASCGADATVQPAPGKKVVAYGWGAPNTQYIREHWQEIDEMPLDGMGLTVAIDRSKPTVGDGATANMLNWHLFGPKRFEAKDFGAAADDLKSARWTRPKDLFLAASIVSRDQDHEFNWFDDARWETILSNWRLFATIARDGGCRGIFIDPEQYGTYFFNYPEMNQRVARDFPDYVEQVRKRGRELMQAGREVFPDAVYSMMWAHSYLKLHPTERFIEPQKNSYGLLPAFIDGMLEASSDQTVFHDWNEFAYGFRERQEFLQAYHGIINESAALSAVPETYRARMRAGFALWIDNDRRWSTTDFTQNYFSPQQFELSLRNALDISDEYVWIYSEKARLFPPGTLPTEYLEAIRKARTAAAGN